MTRASISPFADLRTLFLLWMHFQRLRPDTVLPYTMKPIIYGGLAARLARVPHRFALMTGFGHVFTNNSSSSINYAVRCVSIWLYQRALTGAQQVFVYNQTDASEVQKHGIIRDPERITLVPGSGVDFDYYTRSDPLLEPPTFLLIARLLRDKGIVEYVQAARYLRQRYPNFRAQLLGPFDPNPSAISPAEVDGWVSEGVIEYLGATRDVRPFLAQSTVFVLPSYREGIPRSILEAMATGRAIITTDVPGCRETVVDRDNGRLVPPRDPTKLAEAMASFLKEPELAARMGRRSHEVARERFDVHAVNRLILSHMRLT